MIAPGGGLLPTGPRGRKNSGKCHRYATCGWYSTTSAFATCGVSCRSGVMSSSTQNARPLFEIAVVAHFAPGGAEAHAGSTTGFGFFGRSHHFVYRQQLVHVD